MLDLLNINITYLAAILAPFLGAALLILSLISLLHVFRPGKSAGKVPLMQVLVAMAASLLVIAVILMLQRDYAGQDVLYGTGAFLNVIGAILAMTGSLLIQAFSGKAQSRSPTGFQALAERSMRPTGDKGWKPPETSVRLPRCPYCQEELQPDWKACPACGRALISGDRERYDKL